MSVLDNEAVETSVFNESTVAPVGPKPRSCLKSYLDRSYNFTMPHRNVTIRDKMRESCTSIPEGEFRRKNLDLTPPYDEITEERELTINSEEDSVYTSLRNESQGFTNRSFNEITGKPVETSTPEKTLKTVNSRRVKSHSERTSKYRRLESAYSPINGTYEQQKPKSFHPVKKSTRSSDNGTFLSWGTAIMICTVLIVAMYVYYHNNVTAHKSTEEPTQDPQTLIGRLQKSIEHLKQEFHQQEEDMWYEVTSAVRDVILDPTKPSMLILFANESNTLNCLARSIAVVASQALNSNNYLTLTRYNMGNNLGQIIHTLKSKIEEKPVVVVQDLLNIHPDAMKAFHNLCDRENPLVKRAVYIITMVTNEYEKSENPLFFIEQQIIGKLSPLIDEDILKPLLTRLTEGPAIAVQAQQDLTNCLSM